jgi:hypothetical protein
LNTAEVAYDADSSRGCIRSWHEDDQLFLDDHNSHMQEEQTELLVKVNRLTIPVRVFSIGSGVFLLVLVAMLIYQKLNEVQ